LPTVASEEDRFSSPISSKKITVHLANPGQLDIEIRGKRTSD
jgi:hypothetical protein